MTNLDIAQRRVPRIVELAHRWWPLPAFIAVSLICQEVLLMSRYDVGGHAAGHLAGATVPFMAAAVLSIVFWATPPSRRQIDLLLVGAVWLATTILVLVGNLRVVDDLIAAGYGRTPTGSIPDIADHGLANSSVWYAEAAALVLIGAWRRRGHIGNRATMGAVATTLVVPPWFIPGAGVIVLAIVRLAHRGRAVSAS
jgi:hypothetical protein